MVPLPSKNCTSTLLQGTRRSLKSQGSKLPSSTTNGNTTTKNSSSSSEAAIPPGNYSANIPARTTLAEENAPQRYNLRLQALTEERDQERRNTEIAVQDRDEQHEAIAQSLMASHRLLRGRRAEVCFRARRSKEWDEWHLPEESLRRRATYPQLPSSQAPAPPSQFTLHLSLAVEKLLASDSGPELSITVLRQATLALDNTQKHHLINNARGMAVLFLLIQ